MKDLADYQSIVEQIQNKQAVRKTRNRILLVDDDELILDSLGSLLKNHAYEVELAKNGFQALECLDVETYALIICDLQMPGISGIEMVESMRSTCKLSDNRMLPVIFVSGMCELLPKRAKQLKLLDCISKPIDDDLMLHQIKIYLGY